MEIRNVLERLKLLTNDDREDLLLMLSGDAVQWLKARLCCTEEEENAQEEALCAAAAAQAAYQFWLLEEAASPKSLTAGEVPGMEVLDLELRRSGPSYTSDTPAELHAQYPEGRSPMQSSASGRCPGFCVTRIFTSA